MVDKMTNVPGHEPGFPDDGCSNEHGPPVTERERLLAAAVVAIIAHKILAGYGSLKRSGYKVTDRMAEWKAVHAEAKVLAGYAELDDEKGTEESLDLAKRILEAYR